MSRIVIIEDDALMRSLLVEWLTAEGYAVGTDAGGEPDAGGAAALVILNLYMPRQVGTSRLDAARRAYPGVPIVAISGQFSAGVHCAGATARTLGVEGVIAKPCTREALLDAVRSLIATPSASRDSECRA